MNLLRSDTSNDRYINKNHILAVDNFFSSPGLFIALAKVGIGAVGTVKSSAKGGDAPGLNGVMGGKATGKKWEHGQWDHRQYGNLVYTIWKDSKVVRLLSSCVNFHNVKSDDNTIGRKKKDGDKKQVDAPPVLLVYAQNYGGVDKHDQFTSYYDAGRPYRKWWHRLFWWGINSAVANAWIIRQHDRNGRTNLIKQKDFRLEVCKQLIGDTVRKQRGGQNRIRSLSDGDHYPTKSDGKRQCVHCSVGKNNRVRSAYECDRGCGSLCVECFGPYHKAMRRRSAAAAEVDDMKE
jgi:hypothetical protein